MPKNGGGAYAEILLLREIDDWVVLDPQNMGKKDVQKKIVACTEK